MDSSNSNGFYSPDAYTVKDTKKITDFIREYSLGTIFSSTSNGMNATSVPLLVDDNCTMLEGHMSRGNPQWHNLDGKRILVYFQGPNHYISPLWYGEDKSVSTWNYVSVRITGVFNIIEDDDLKMQLLDRQTSFHEHKVGQDWYPDWSYKNFSGMLSGIIAFRINVEDFTGTWKLSQNHPKKSVLNMSEKLESLANPNSIEIARLAREAVK